MFDNKVDISKVYGATKCVVANNTKHNHTKKKYINSTKVYREYQNMRKTVDFKQWWNKQYAQQHALCYYCKESLKTKRINVEHIVPMSRGGTNNKKNLVLSCSDCNKKKGSKLLKKKYRKELRFDLQKQIRTDNRIYRANRIIDEQIGFELRQMFKEG